ncbi:hypothetical protein D3C76_1656700 [compost metagenome]
MNQITVLVTKILIGNQATAQLLDKPTTVNVVSGYNPQPATTVNCSRQYLIKTNLSIAPTRFKCIPLPGTVVQNRKVTQPG